MLPASYVEKLEEFYEYLIGRIEFSKKGRMHNPWPHSRKVDKILSKLSSHDLPCNPFVIESINEIRLRLSMDRQSFDDMIPKARERNLRYLWATAVVAHAIGARNRYEHVRRSLKLRGTDVSSERIKTSVRRYERQCLGYFRTKDWPRWLMQDLFNEFKVSQWRRRHKEGKLPTCHLAENGAFIILNQSETGMIKVLTSQRVTGSPDASHNAHTAMERAYSTVISVRN